MSEETKRGPGRPPKPKPERPKRKPFRAPRFNLDLTPDVHRKAVKLVSEGKTHRQAAALLGIPVPTFNGWLNQGRKKLAQEEYQHPLSVFALELEAAKAHFEGNLIADLEWDLDNGIRATDRASWVKRRLQYSSPQDWSDRALSQESGILSQEDVEKAIASLDERIQRILSATLPEETTVTETESQEAEC